jgi:chemotaxis protein MotB
MLQRLLSLTDHRVRAALFATAAAALASLGGCVAQQPYDQVMAENRSLKDQNQQLQADAQQSRSEAEIERAQRQKAEGSLVAMQNKYGILSGQLDTMAKGVGDMDGRLARIQFLDPTTSSALQALADEYPSLIKYDASRGMLRFSSDLTFDSGQDAVKPEAKESLAALAKILSSTTAARYEVHIVGHTDAQPISGGTAPRHATNMHLSCHRAISVRTELVNLGVPQNKLMAAGWGDQMPIAPNDAKGKSAQNRRVEIFLVPIGGTTETAPTTTSTPPPQPEIMK